MLNELANQPPLGRAEVRRRLRAGILRLKEPLRILAEELRGEEDAPIDWVAALPSGRAVVGLLRLTQGDAGLLADGLVQRAWVATRLRDWEKLAPGLEIRPELRPVLLLVAPGFSRTLRIAAREADGENLWLAAYRWNGSGPELRLEVGNVLLPSPAPDTAPPEPAAPRSAFRTGLSDEELTPAPDEPAWLA